MKQSVAKLRLSQNKRYSRTGLMILALVLSISFSFVSTTAAHALLVKSNPEDGAQLQQPPERLTAWFSQELDSGFSLIQVFDVEGRQVDNGDGGVDLYDPDHTSMTVTLPDTLTDGTYIARWNVVSTEDGDETKGEFTFRVGDSEVTINQTSVAETSLPNNSREWPIGQLILAVGVLFVVVVVVAGTTLFSRTSTKKTVE